MNVAFFKVKESVKLTIKLKVPPSLELTVLGLLSLALLPRSWE